MLYTDLSKTSSVIINSGAEHIVYFGTETADEPGDHGAGGKTILTASEYTGTVSIAIAPSTAGSPLLVQTRHETTTGVAAEITSYAHVDCSDVAVTRDVSVTGSVASDKRLTVVLYNPNAHTVTVNRVDVRLLSQAI